MLAKYREFIDKTQTSILSAAFVLSAASAINAALGFVKGRTLATFFGDSADLAVFYTADRIPDLIYSVLVVGALSTVFIPVFTSFYKKDKEKAWSTASSIINITLFMFGVFSLIVVFGADLIMRILSINTFDPAQIALGASLMRILILAQLLLVGSSFLSSILQSFKYFLIPALAPIAYNLGFILGTILFSKSLGIYGPALGVVIGAFLHLMIQVPQFNKVGFKFSLSWKFKQNGTSELFRLMPARIGSVLVNNLISTINNSLAILVSASAVVHLKFANQLQFFPVHLFGFSIAHASLTTLSEEYDEENLGKFKRTLITSFHQMMYLVIPASVILFVLRVPVVRIVYGASTFPWEATVKTSYALAFYAISIFAQAGIYLFTRAFYAMKDTSTPVKISIGTIFVNIFLSLLFIKYLGWGVWSVAFSFSITSLLNFVLLYIFLSKKTSGLEYTQFVTPFVKISFSALIMGFSLYFPMKLLDQFVFDTTRTFPLILLTAVASMFGMATYLLLTYLMKVEEIELLYRLLRKLNLKKTSQTLSQDATLV